MTLENPRYRLNKVSSTSEGFDQRLSDLTREFLDHLQSRVGLIHDRFQRLQNNPEDMESLSEMRYLSHKLAGSGATFGYDEVSRKARELENLIAECASTEPPIDSGQVSRISSAIVRLEEACSVALPELDAADAEEPEPAQVTPEMPVERRDILLLCPDTDSLIEDLRNQLGFFGFEVHGVKSIGDLVSAVVQNPNHLAILHTDILADKEAQARLTRLREEHHPYLSYIWISDRMDFNVRLSALRTGSEAFFYLPVDIARLVDTLESLNNQKESEPFHILIVDDDPEQVSFYALILQRAGMITSVASDPKTVLDVLVESKPELILMDMYMPGASGTELLSLIRQQEAFVSIPVVFLSVEDSEEKKLAAIRLGGDDFITKPVRPEYLLASITNRVRRTRDIRYYMERDSLTGLLNHSNLKEQLIRELLRGGRSGQGLCFAMIDLDHFKKVNDAYGHLTGDRVLKSLSRILQERLRRTDIIGRYGGEEFGVILLNTSCDHAERILNEIRDNFAHIRQQSDEGDFFVTFSCGIACYPPTADANAVTSTADRALYEAKEQGRNRVIVACK